MPTEAQTLGLLENALSEYFQFHEQLDTFVVRAGFSRPRLDAARKRAEARKGRWTSAPKRFVAQEIVADLHTGKAIDDKLIANLITALIRSSSVDVSDRGIAAIEALKVEVNRGAEESFAKREQVQREQEQRLRDDVGCRKADKRREFEHRFLSMCSAPDTPQARGYALEKLLNEFLEFEGFSPRASFKLIGEQIDGSFAWDGKTFLAEAKWTSARVDGSGFGAFDWKISGKSVNTRGLFIAINGYSEQAIKALNGKGALRFVCFDGAHLMHAFRNGLPAVFELVWRHADETGDAYLPVSSARFILIRP